MYKCLLLLQMLARYRQKDTLPVVLPYIQNVLMEYTSAPLESKSYQKKDGALVAIAVLAKVNMRCLVRFLCVHVSVLLLLLHCSCQPTSMIPISFRRFPRCLVHQ